ncbi:unnamed protein product [Cuscuta europaea]|uniref:Uncharacterized protein n=1 Tax=Cuscuta europaea TaxID=41803 RepID=A0A9P0ZZA1_CUSEU|nr:unnamed protein product [Cuscuta europaea]
MVAETKHERNERTSKLGLLDGSFKSVTVDQSQSTQDSLQGCSFTANNSSNSPSYVRIESKVLCFSIDSSFLHITQIKGIKSRTISLDKDEANWLLNSFHYIKSGASWVFTRYDPGPITPKQLICTSWLVQKTKDLALSHMTPTGTPIYNWFIIPRQNITIHIPSPDVPLDIVGHEIGDGHHYCLPGVIPAHYA